MALTFLDPIIVNTAATFTFANVAVTANVTAGSLKTDNLLYANGQPFAFPVTPGGSNSQIQFNDAGTLGGNPNFTFSKASNTLSVSSIVASGIGLSNLPGANVSGQVANALIAGTVYTNAQPNITSVGTLTALSITGNISAGNASLGNLVTANFISGSGNLLSNIQGANVSGAVSFATTANAVAGANVSGAVGLATFATTANAVAGANVSGVVANATYAVSAGSATTAATVTTNAQPNITSVGTLASLTVTGNISSGNAALGNSVTANYFAGNGSSLSGITGANVTGTVSFATTANAVAGANVSGQVANALIAGTVYTNAQPNITTVGTLSSLTVTGNVSVGNLSGTLLSGTLSTAAQPNITSVGILSGLSVGNTLLLQQSTEVMVPKTGATGTVVHDFLGGATFFHSSPAANFIANFTNIPTTNDRSIVVVLLINQGVTPYIPSSLQIAGVSQTINWLSGAVGTGTASKLQAFTFVFLRVSSAWIVTGQSATFG